jgi:Xaa-Pro dipeptidase
MYNIIKTGATLSPTSYQQLDKWLALHQLDAVLCLLPENVVYFADTLPILGVSAVYYLPGNRPILLVPESEFDWANGDHCELMPFSFGHLGDSDFYANLTNWCADLHKRFGQNIRSLGVELTSPVAAPTFSAAEMTPPDQTWFSLLREQFPESELRDATPGLIAARSIKPRQVLARIKRSNQIAKLGLDALQISIRPGMSEVEAAALVESEIRVRGTGFDGAHLVKAFAQVTSGVEGTIRQSMLTPSGLRKFETGDLVMIELAVCADGLWSDLTRVYCVGKPNTRQRNV